MVKEEPALVPSEIPEVARKKSNAAEPAAKRVRSRPGSIMVDLGPDGKDLLDQIRDVRAAELRAASNPEIVTISSTVRHLVYAFAERHGLKPRAK